MLKGITFGPVMNWSFGGSKTDFSFGMNAAYWDYRTEIPWSLNFGIETSRENGRLLYSELQTGEVIAGASTGLVYSVNKGFGVQASIWGNLIGGVQLRYRHLDGPRFVPGLYIAIPAVRTSGTMN